MRLTWLADVARGAGLRVSECAGWRTRGRDYGSPQVVVCHHTGESPHSGDAGGLGTVVRGRADLPGPIANYYLSRSGIVYVVAAGVANNAGKGNARRAGHPEWSGNSRTIGIEAANSGKEPWPTAQYTAYVALAAAVCRRMGWGVSRVVAHKEWSTTGKPDPSFGMDVFRANVARAINTGTPNPGEGELSTQDANRVIAEGYKHYLLLRYGVMNAADAWNTAKRQAPCLQTNHEEIIALTAAVDALAKKVGVTAKDLEAIKQAAREGAASAGKGSTS